MNEIKKFEIDGYEVVIYPSRINGFKGEYPKEARNYATSSFRYTNTNFVNEMWVSDLYEVYLKADKLYPSPFIAASWDEDEYNRKITIRKI